MPILPDGQQEWKISSSGEWTGRWQRIQRAKHGASLLSGIEKRRCQFHNPELRIFIVTPRSKLYHTTSRTISYLLLGPISAPNPRGAIPFGSDCAQLGIYGPCEQGTTNVDHWDGQGSRTRENSKVYSKLANFRVHYQNAHSNCYKFRARKLPTTLQAERDSGLAWLVLKTWSKSCSVSRRNPQNLAALVRSSSDLVTPRQCFYHLVLVSGKTLDLISENLQPRGSFKV